MLFLLGYIRSFWPLWGFFKTSSLVFSPLLSHLLESLRRSSLHVSGRFGGPRQTVSHQSLLQTPPGLVHLQLLLPEETETRGSRKQTARKRKRKKKELDFRSLHPVQCCLTALLIMSDLLLLLFITHQRSWSSCSLSPFISFPPLLLPPVNQHPSPAHAQAPSLSPLLSHRRINPELSLASPNFSSRLRFN